MGWVGGWVECLQAILRIAYSNKNDVKYKKNEFYFIKIFYRSRFRPRTTTPSTGAELPTIEEVIAIPVEQAPKPTGTRYNKDQLFP